MMKRRNTKTLDSFDTFPPKAELGQPGHQLFQFQEISALHYIVYVIDPLLVECLMIVKMCHVGNMLYGITL